MDLEIFMFTLEEELTMFARLVVALIAGGIVGLERRLRDRPAGIRTLSLVSVGACLFTLVSIFGFTGLGTVQDPARVAAQIVTGVGFIGAGTMIASQAGMVRGLTTASGIWVVAGLGMAAGVGMYAVAIGGSLLTAVVLYLFPRSQNRSTD